MNGKLALVLLLSGSLFACAQPPAVATTAAPPPQPPAVTPAPLPASVAEPAPAGRLVSILRVRCARMIELPQDDRAAASLFYIGYQAARLRTRAIDISAIPTAEAWAYDYCGAHPDQPAVEAFRRAYLRTLI